MPKLKRFLSWLFTAFMIVIVWLAIAYRLPGPAIVVSRETTFLTEPLHADGLPDYTRYLLDREREGVTAENNGAIPFLQAMWPAGLKELDYGPISKELGMEIPRERGMRDASLNKELIAKLAEWLVSIDPQRAELVRQREERAEAELDMDDLWEEPEEEYDPKDEAYNLVYWGQEQPWRREEIPLLAEWVDQHRPFYDLLHEAAARERFYCPSPDFLGTPQVDMVRARFPVSQDVRSAVRCLALSANLALGEGDTAAAWRDCRAMFRLADHVPREFMLGELISINTETAAHETARLILSDPQLDAVTAREMLEFFRELPARDGLAELVDTWERMAALSYSIGMSQQGGDLRRLEDDNQTDASGKSFDRSLDWNWVLLEINLAYDAIVADLESGNWKRGATLNPFGGLLSDDPEPPGPVRAVKAYASRRARTREIGLMMLPALLPAWQHGMQAQVQANNHRQLLTVAAALTVYRLEQGEYPEHLTDLVPALLPALPADPYHGSPPVYRRMDGGFLLYSLGPNGQDEGGSNDQLNILEGAEVILYDLEETLENENNMRQLLGRPLVSEEEFAEIVKPADGEAGEERGQVRVKKLVEEIPENADDHAIRLPLPRLKLPGFPSARE